VPCNGRQQQRKITVVNAAEAIIKIYNSCPRYAEVAASNSHSSSCVSKQESWKQVSSALAATVPNLSSSSETKT